MKKLTFPNFAISLILMGMLFAASNAHSGGYVGADYVMVNTDITDHTGIQLKAGYKFNDVISFEGKALVSSSVEQYQGVDLEIDSMVSLNLKVTLPLTDSFNAFGSIGYGRAEATARYQGYSASASDSGQVFGFGLSYDILEAYTITAEYSQPAEDIDMYSVGLSINF